MHTHADRPWCPQSGVLSLRYRPAQRTRRHRREQKISSAKSVPTPRSAQDRPALYCNHARSFLRTPISCGFYAIFCECGDLSHSLPRLDRHFCHRSAKNSVRRIPRFPDPNRILRSNHRSGTQTVAERARSRLLRHSRDDRLWLHRTKDTCDDRGVQVGARPLGKRSKLLTCTQAKARGTKPRLCLGILSV